MILPEFATTIIGVIVLLGGLIFFHELGHYLVAKFFNVKVEVFSLGFGKKIFSKQIGETQYCLSIIPFGGYVKMMGDDPYKGVPPEDAARAFLSQRLYKRFAIVAAGPLANLLLAFVLYIAVFSIGQPHPSYKVGSVVVGSPAWEAGLRPRDRIIEIDSVKMQTWSDLESSLKDRQGVTVEMSVVRNGSELRLPYKVVPTRSRNAYGEEIIVGGLKGATPYAWAPKVGVSNPESLAFKAGLRTGDEITKVGTQEISVYDELSEALVSAVGSGSPVTISFKRPKPDNKEAVTEMSVSLLVPKNLTTSKNSLFGMTSEIGIFPSEVFVKRVEKGSPAEKGGLEPGDRIVKIGDTSIFNFDSIIERVQEQGAKAEGVAFVLERGGKEVRLLLTPIQTEHKDPISGKPTKRYMIGLEPMLAYMPAEMTTLKFASVGGIISHAAKETWDITEKTVVSVYKLATRQIDSRHLGGPVMIAQLAGKSLDAGIVHFLQMMALVSINLFLLNLFPIPILDGGHLLFFTIEAIKRRPVSMRTMEIAARIGMMFILALVGLTLFNDISRAIH